MTIYNIHYTDKTKTTIDIDETNINDTVTDLTFFGRKRLQYGQEMNQNILNILENFACPEATSGSPSFTPLVPIRPDLTVAVNSVNSQGGTTINPLNNPVDGQFWFNSTQQRIFSWDATGGKWIPVAMEADIAANWGIIADGETIPLPINATTGQPFDISDCSWIVSPYKFPQQVDYMLVDSDANALVTSVYNLPGVPTPLISGFATYLIVAIKGNINLGSLTPVPSSTPTAVPTATPAPSGATPTPSPTPTPTQTPGVTPVPVGGPLTAYFEAQQPVFNGDVAPLFPGEGNKVKYPAVTSHRYKILYTTTTPAAPFDPWTDAGGGVYYIFIQEASPNFISLASLYHQIIFCSGKPTGTVYPPGYDPMVTGIDGVFYKVTSVTSAGGGVTQIRLKTVALAPNSQYLYNHPPLQTGFIPALTFDYQYVYATGAYYQDFGTDDSSTSQCNIVADNSKQFYMGANPVYNPSHPYALSPYARTYDLVIQGGTPPYTINDLDWTQLGSFDNYYPLVIVAGGLTAENDFSNNPFKFVNLHDDITNPSSPAGIAASDFKAHFKGLVNDTTNPRVIPILSIDHTQLLGYRIQNFVTTDLYYGCDYFSKYGTACPPEWFWHIQYNYDGTPIESIACAATTGNVTDFASEHFSAIVTDNALPTSTYSTLTGGELVHTLKFQTVDNNFMNQSINYGPTVIAPGGVNPTTPITAAGDYTWTIIPNLSSGTASGRPIASPVQMQYVTTLALSNPTNTPTGAGQYTASAVSARIQGVLYNSGSTHPVSNANLFTTTTTGNCITLTGSYALVHTGCSINPSDPPEYQCLTIGTDPTHVGGPFGSGQPSGYYVPFGALQPNDGQIFQITKVWDNVSHSVITLAHPITVQLYVDSSATGSFIWNSAKPDRSALNNETFTTAPFIQYNYKVKVTLPSGNTGVNASIVLPLYMLGYDTLAGCAIGTAGGKFYPIQFNFNIP